MRTKRVGLFLLIAGLIWFALAVVLVKVPWAMDFRSDMNSLFRFATPAVVQWHVFARFMLFEALFFGYKQALAVIVLGLGLLLL